MSSYLRVNRDFGTSCCKKCFSNLSIFSYRNIDAANETIATLKENGFKLNFFTFEALLQYHAKAGDLENIEQTFGRYKEENVELLNRDIFKVMCELAVNGHADKIDSLIPHLKPNMEMRRSLLNAITVFVENKQSSLVPKILQAADGDVNGKFKFLIQEMIRLSTSEAEFTQTIETIEAHGTTIENQFNIFRPALEGPSEEIIRKLLAHMKSRSMEVSEHLFEKLFKLAAKKGVEEVLDVVNLMCSDFGIQPQITFVRDVILPGLDGKENPALASAKLQTTKIRYRNVIMAVVNNSLNHGDIKTAYEFLRGNQSYYGNELIKRPLLKAFTTTGDVENFVPFVRTVHDSYSKINDYYQEKKFSDAEIHENQKKFVEEILYSAISNRRTDTKLITDLLNAFIEEGLAIRPEQAEKIQTLLQVNSGTQIGRLLKSLCSETLELKPAKVQRNTSNVLNQLKSADIQNILEVKVAQGHSAVATEKLLFLAYIREGNTIEIETMLANGKFSLSNSDYALLIELYTRNGNLENAINMLKRVCANNASFKLDAIKVARLVTLMVEKDRNFNEIEALLLAHRQGKPEFRIFVFEHLFDRLAYNGQVKLVEKLFDTLLKYSYIEPTIESTAPLIAVYLKSSKFAEAVDKYEYLSTNYNLVPMTMVLFVHLIRHNEIDLLQRAYDIFERVNGENMALCRLAFAFVESGQDRQARAIFENERTKNISRFISRECKQYVNFSRLDSAKTLLKATKGLYCDRHIIYATILDIYEKENKAKEALDLWCEYSTEDGIIVKPSFKNKLATLLKTNKMEIPFETDSSESSTDTNPPKTDFNQEKATI